MTTLENASISTKSNIYFDGKCISHTVVMADGSKKTVGVIFPASLTFKTGAPEVMEIVAGSCRVRIDGISNWTTYGPGQRFSVGANSSFEIDVLSMLDYVCHFG